MAVATDFFALILTGAPHPSAAFFLPGTAGVSPASSGRPAHVFERVTEHNN
jgi:hypothetical protein